MNTILKNDISFRSFGITFFDDFSYHVRVTSGTGQNVKELITRYIGRGLAAILKSLESIRERRKREKEKGNDKLEKEKGEDKKSSELVDSSKSSKERRRSKLF